jgi:hypothetical protein
LVTTHPEILSAAAGDLQGIGSAMAAQNAAAAGPISAASYAATEAANAASAG